MIGTESWVGTGTRGTRTRHRTDATAGGTAAPIVVVRALGFELCMAHLLQLFVKVAFAVSGDDTLKQFGCGYTRCSAGRNKFT